MLGGRGHCPKSRPPDCGDSQKWESESPPSFTSRQSTTRHLVSRLSGRGFPLCGGTKKQIDAIERARLDPLTTPLLFLLPVSPAPRPVRIKNLSTTERLFLHLLFLPLFLLLPLPLLLPPYRTSLPLVPEIWNKNRVARQPGTSGTDELGTNRSLFFEDFGFRIIHDTRSSASARVLQKRRRES